MCGVRGGCVGYGVDNKVVLRFDKPFWPYSPRFSKAYIQCTDQRFRFVDLHKVRAIPSPLITEARGSRSLARQRERASVRLLTRGY